MFNRLVCISVFPATSRPQTNSSKRFLTVNTMPLEPTDLAPESQEPYPDSETPAEETAEAGESSLPASFFETLPAPGDRITLEIGDVDADNGTVVVKRVSSKPTDEAKGAKALAAKFD